MSQFIWGIGVGAFLSFAYQKGSLNLAQWLYDAEAYTDLQRVSKNVFQLDYVHKGVEYSIRIPIKAGPKSVISVQDGEEDVYNEIYPYLGPNHDFHQQSLTPGDLGHERLQFFCVDGEVYDFEKNEVIKLP